MTTIDNPVFDVMDKRFHVDDPWPMFAWLRAHAPLFWEETNGVWVASSYDMVSKIERMPLLFSSAEGIRYRDRATLSILNMDYPEHARHRRILSRGFTPNRIALLRDQIREITTEVLDGIEGLESFDYVAEVARPIPTRVIAGMLGLPSSMGEQLRTWSDTMLAGDDIEDDSDPRLLAASAAFGEWVTFVQPRLEDRRANPGTDLISLLVAAEEMMSHDDLLMFLTLLLVAGNDTTRNTMAGGLLALSRNPDQYELLREDRSLIPSAVEEILRWVTPVLMHLRTVTEDTVFEGHELRTGQKVCLLWPSANRDEAVFPNADRFVVTRSDNNHRTFGFGPHFCLGAHLARLEMEVLLEEQLRRFPTLHVPDGVEPTYADGTLIRGITSLAASLAG